MLHKCVVRGCGNDVRRKEWLSIEPLKTNWYTNSKICSLHFNEIDYNTHSKHLKPTATPFFFDDGGISQEMSLYTKQDFCPPILSRRWLAIKFRPNMLIKNHHHVISILESGLLFREDSVEVEQEASSPEEVWRHAGGGRGGWLTRGEGTAAVVAVAACVAAFPPRSFHRSTLLHLAGYSTLPVLIRWWHRYASSGALQQLLLAMREYLALARRAAACLKEYKALHATIESIASVIECTHTLLCRQQSALCVCMSRASSALLGNAPWLRGDVAWAAVDTPQHELTKIHHAFLVVQSTLLKHIAMAHFVPPLQAQRIYKNHNERIYWIHHSLIKSLTEEFRQNYESLERMYRLLRNIGNSDTTSSKKPGSAMLDSWLYSDVHNGIARTCLELKLVSNKCNSIDVFLDSCALNKQELDLNVLAKDIDELVDGITKCLSTVQNSQIRLKKIRNKVVGLEKEVVFAEKVDIGDDNIVKIKDEDAETKDEVFYFVKTEDNEVVQPVSDVTTGPGKRERETTEVVMSELKRKLGKREDVMRERERQALVNTMPEYKNSVPEFPRQIKFEDFIEMKGFLCKIKKENVRKLFRSYKISKPKKEKKFQFKTKKFFNEDDITEIIYKTTANPKVKSNMISVSVVNKCLVITKWLKRVAIAENANGLDSSCFSDGLSDVEVGTVNKTVNEAKNEANGHVDTPYKFTKKDLELSNSSSESDFEVHREQLALLKDLRRHRVARKKNYPKIPSKDKEDESLKPIEYSFGTGMAMASVLQINNAKMPPMVQEELFIGDGEVSQDSGNDEDA